MLTSGVTENKYAGDSGIMGQFASFINAGTDIFVSTVDKVSGVFDDTKNQLNDVSQKITSNEFFQDKQPDTTGAQAQFAITKQQSSNDKLIIMILIALVAIVAIKGS